MVSVLIKGGYDRSAVRRLDEVENALLSHRCDVEELGQISLFAKIIRIDELSFSTFRQRAVVPANDQPDQSKKGLN